MPTTCLGTRVVALVTKSSWGSSHAAGTKDSGDEAASLLVECNEKEGRNSSVLEIKLWTGHGESYGCTISPSDAPSLMGGGPGGDSASTMLALGRWLVRENTHDASSANTTQGEDSLQKRFQNLCVAFQYEHVSPGESTSSSKHLFLLVHETLANGMRRKILRTRLERVGGDESSSSTGSGGGVESGLWYARAVGEALNRTLRQAEQLRAARAQWKQTADDLQRMQQVTKDTLLQNFTTLRNSLVQRHLRQIADLQHAHAAEKESWAAKAAEASAKTLTTKKTPKPKKTQPDVEVAGDLFDEDEVLALARGQKLDATGNATTTTTTRNHSASVPSHRTHSNTPRKKAFLKPDEAVDMVAIRRQALEFERNRKEKRKRQRESSNRKEDHNYPDSSDTEDDMDTTYKSPVGRHRTKKPRQPTASPTKNTSRNTRADTAVGSGAARGNSNTARKSSHREKPSREWQSSKKIQDKPKMAKGPAPTMASPPRSTKPPTPADDGSSSSESSWVLR